METIDRLWQAYNLAMTYEQYVGLSEEIAREKHLHYQKKMKMSKEEQKQIAAADTDAKLLIFCDPACSDCRITTAIIDNMEKYKPSLEVRLALREDNLSVMEELDKEARIPMVVLLKEKEWDLIFYEIPTFLKELAKSQKHEEKKEARSNFQSGLFKRQVMEQILNALY